MFAFARGAAGVCGDAVAGLTLLGGRSRCVLRRERRRVGRRLLLHVVLQQVKTVNRARLSYIGTATRGKWRRLRGWGPAHRRKACLLQHPYCAQSGELRISTAQRCAPSAIIIIIILTREAKHLRVG